MTSPNPMRTPSFSHHPVIVTVSPSARNFRSSPFGSSIDSVPRQLS
jgi:hypothetical protein